MGQPNPQPDWPEPIFNPLKMTHFWLATRLICNPIDPAQPAHFAMSSIGFCYNYKQRENLAKVLTFSSNICYLG